MKTLSLLGAAALASLFVSHAATAGDLNPPAGAISPTDRVVLNAQVITLPHTISTPGSYVLTSNFLAPGAVDGFTIDAHNVTLDLNGFSVTGVAGSGYGILAMGGTSNVVIKNGHVHNWGAFGVTNEASSGRVEDVISTDNGGVGITAGAGGMVRSCTSRRNGGTGIAVAFNTLVESCIAEDNVTDGIESPRNGVIRACVARGNMINGIRAGESSIIVNCEVSGNMNHGIQAFDGCVVTTSVAFANSGNGIVVGRQSTVTDCTSRANTGNGINLNSSDGSARRCVVSKNQLGGILAAADCTVIGNVCRGNSQAGIALSADGSRVEGNTVSGSLRGIFTINVTVAGNTILANRATANVTNYDIVPGNAFGPIINVAGAGNIALVAGSDHPFANFEY